ncbi:hypothetical protein [Bradyrhizobium sp. 25ACV]
MSNSVRLAFVALGIAGICWCVVVLPVFRSAVLAREITDRIVRDDRFGPGALTSTLLQLGAENESVGAEPSVSRARALTRLWLAERSLQQNEPDADQQFATAEQDLLKSLVNSPIDSFFWMLLYSVTMSRSGLDDKALTYLGQSYTTGPREGWISLRRNRLALAAFPQLGAVMQQMAVAEYSAMVDTDFTEEASRLLMGVGWPHRDRLLASLSKVDLRSRELLSRRLSFERVRVVIPGIELDERPWR